MAKKNNGHINRVTHTEMICWSIKYNEDQLIEWIDQRERAAAIQDPAIQDYCQNEIGRIDETLAILRQMYKTETGVEYCG